MAAPVLMIVPTCSPRSAAVSRDLHPFEVSSGRHDLEERGVEGQRAVELGEVGEVVSRSSSAFAPSGAATH